MDKTEQTFTRFLNDEEPLAYPDFDAMWGRLEPNLPGSGETLKAVDMAAPRRKRFRKTAVISAVAVLLVATPVFAALSYNWDGYLNFHSGIRSALQQGLGQSIEKSVKQDGVTLTVNTAVVDDNRTVLLFNVSGPKANAAEFPYFSKTVLKDGSGKDIKGNQRLIWNEESKTWRGYFDTEWTPDQLQADVQFSVQNLQFFSSVEHQIPLNPNTGSLQTFEIGKDGIGQLAVQPFVQGEKMMFATSTTFSQPEAKEWTNPRIAVFNNDVMVKEAGGGAFGKPGDNGEYTGQQFYPIGDLQQPSLQYKLLYTQKVREINKEWSLDLHLDKRQMQSGTVVHNLNVPVESGAGRMVLQQMIVTPTQIRIKASHEKYARLPYLNYHLEVNGTILNGMIWNQQGDNPEETTFRFELPPGVQITDQTPVSFVAKYEVIEQKDAKEPIHLKDISEEKKTITTLVGGYSVNWTYYKQNGNLYVQSECADPSFGGINQTYMGSGSSRLIGKPVTVNFPGDGNNQNIDVYENYQGSQADVQIFWYNTEIPEKELRVELIR